MVRQCVALYYLDILAFLPLFMPPSFEFTYESSYSPAVAGGSYILGISSLPSAPSVVRILV